MTENKQVYRCNICGNIVEVMHAGGGSLVCCGQLMELLEEKTEDTGFEKHVPVIEKTANGLKVKVGSIPHPMEENHFIEWIEVLVDNCAYIKSLKPGDEPQAEFEIKIDDTSKISAREYCSIHGLWKSV
ncbi:MAG: desulfoferrodoxin [Methanobacterium sp.]|uniref:desulfoferrodoxin n=1 Tax=Methanobacterium sp. TaxID=2164 RepID=UPI003D6493B3|nr:desulfoferrodoxin [Methanobacterium sp.]